MKPNPFQTYFLTCFLLLIPILVWNLAFSNQLPPVFQPAVFWKDIPPLLAFGENGLRWLVFGLAYLMPLSLALRTQKAGFIVYGAGLLLYFSSWLVLLYAPDSPWSHSLWGFLAPAYTPFVWLMGIGLIGRSFSFNLPYRPWIFGAVSVLFLLFHLSHAFLVYKRLHE